MPTAVRHVSEDTYIAEIAPDATFGTGSIVSVQLTPGSLFWGLMAFNVGDAIPPVGSNVISAQIRFEIPSAATNGTLRMQAIVGGVWSEVVETWNLFATRGIVYGPNFSDLAVTAKGIYVLDCTAAAQDAVDAGVAVHRGYRFIKQTGSLVAHIDSREGTGTDASITYEYTLPVPAVPATPSPLLGAEAEGEAPPPLQRVSVQSSHFNAVRYDEAKQMLEVEFKKGGLYLYHGVPKSEYDALLTAKSKGEYLARRIKRVYRFTKGGIS